MLYRTSICYKCLTARRPALRGRPTRLVHTHARMTTKALTTETWPDFENLFSRYNGVWGGCWCMFYHKSGSFNSKDYEKNRKEKSQLVRQDRSHGILVYCNSEPVGWCQFGPREELPGIDRKRGYKSTDQNAWRITCLFVARDHRARGVARSLSRPPSWKCAASASLS